MGAGDAAIEPNGKSTSVLQVVRTSAEKYLKRRYQILFYALVFTIVASPIASALEVSGSVIEFLLAISLLAAVMPAAATGKTRSLLLAASVVLLLARSLTAWLGQTRLSYLTLSAWTFVGLLAAAAALRFAMRGTKVEAEHVFAALSAYLLAGVYFGLLFWALEQIKPGTFAASDFSRTTAIYYSFVTLATIGYGDISP